MRALKSIPRDADTEATPQPRLGAGRLRVADPLGTRPPRPVRSRLAGVRRVAQQLAPETVELIAARVTQMLVQRFLTLGDPTAAGDAPARQDTVAEPVEADGWLRGAEKIAAYLDCPRSRVYALASAGRIAVERDGSALVARKSDLDAWVRAGGGRRP